MEQLQFEDEADVFLQLRPHVDGVVLRYGALRGTFLPQVWEQLTDPRNFLIQLKGKAGLPAHFWVSDIEVYRYTVQKWREHDTFQEAAVTAQALT
ncbi:MAG: AMMECR1 domain-containing protein, partial [Gammaproteobacteria bacterium]